MRVLSASATSTPSQPRSRPGVETMPVRASIGAGRASPTAEQVADRAAEGLDMSLEQQRGAVEFAVVAVVERERRVVLGDDGAADVGDRDVQVPAREVQAGDEAELAGERDLDRAAAAARGDRRVQQTRGRRAP